MLSDSLKVYLEQQHQQQLYRQRVIVESPQGVQLHIGGKRFINFCSNDYLGLANHPRVIEALMQGASRYGVGSGASHLINGHSLAHHQLEEELADFVGRPRALLFSTGYMANLGVISALLGRGDSVFEDRLNHASLLDAGLLSRARLQRYQHANSSDLQSKLLASRAKQKLICSDGVFSMDGDIASLDELIKLAQQQQCWLMIDDAHGLGTVGEHGRGTLEDYGANLEQVPILVGTLGKAFGTFGAFVAGDEVLIEYLIQRARSYIYTTALPPAVAEATRASLRLVSEEAWRREQLRENILYFRQCLAQIGAEDTGSKTAIQPIVVGEVKRALSLSEQLKQQGILVSAIRPPTVPAGSARLRVTLCAEHSHAQIDQLIEGLA